jgi:hypothetical protein
MGTVEFPSSRQSFSVYLDVVAQSANATLLSPLSLLIG